MEIDFKEDREMSRLVRMDHTGHSTIAEWAPGDLDSAGAAAAALQEHLADGWFAVVSEGPGRARQVRELPMDEPLVILRRPIAGG
jgi:hypothetical protein